MRTLIMLGAVLVLGACSSSGDLTLAEEQEIQLAIQMATDSLIARAERTDTDAVFGMYDTDALHIDGGRTMTVDDLRAAYTPLYDRFARLEFTLSRSAVEVLAPDAGIWIGEGTVRGFEADTVGLEVSAAWTIVWHRGDDGEWELHHLHGSTVIPADAM